MNLCELGFLLPFLYTFPVLFVDRSFMMRPRVPPQELSFVVPVKLIFQAFQREFD